jgi:hypothetical protein
MRRFRTKPIAALAFAAAATALAQNPEPPRAPNLPSEFGTTDSQITYIGASEFQPSSSVNVQTGYFINNGTRWPHAGVAGSALLIATLNGRIPEGAIVTRVCVYGVDTSNVADEDLNVFVVRNRVDADTGLNPQLATVLIISSSSDPGNFVACSPTSLRMQSQYDIDGDGTVEAVDHNIFVEFGDNRDVFGGGIRIRGVSFEWHRAVSTAPAIATFADVPTNHPYFAFVEALVASGVTAGCGGGNYCVDQPITRGEMAVFLSAALGLHWPALF